MRTAGRYAHAVSGADERRGRLGACAGTLLFLVLVPGTVAGGVPYWLTGWRGGTPFQPFLFRAVGAMLLLAGLASLLESSARFAIVGLGTPAPPAPTICLVVSGQYRHVRNPMYLAVLAIVLGQALLLARVVLLEYAALLAVAFHLFVVLYEERALAARFGESYAAYGRQVRRWWPRLRPWHGIGTTAVAAVLVLALGCTPSTPSQGRTLLAVFAHPDDEVFVGPLLSHYARQGARVRLAVVTDGAKGPRTSIPAGKDLATVRAAEVRCSCRALGVEPPTLLGFRDDELGRPNDPPTGYLNEVVHAIRTVLGQVNPDVVITWGPEGGYGHPDHRLVGAVVTQLVQAGAKGVPARLLYPALPADRVRRGDHDPHWAVTSTRFLTVRVPYDAADLAATRNAFACHASQFSAAQMKDLPDWLDARLGGRVYLRPWFGAETSDDVFRLQAP